MRLREALAAAHPRMSRAKLFAIFTPALALAVIVVLVVQPFFGVRTAYAQDQFTLTPGEADALGIAPDTSFTLESRDPVSAGDIEKLLVAKTQGNVGYTVDQVSDTSVRIAFDEALVGDEVVTFSLPTTTAWPDGTVATRDYNWAFQVKGDFRVTGTIPGDRASGVPLDTGIEFDFNYENVDPDAFERALTFSPALTGHVEASRRAFVFVPDRLAPATVYTATLSKDLPLVGSDDTLGEDVTLTFETSADETRGFQLSVNDRYQTVTPNQTVALSYYEWGDAAGQDTPAHVRLYRYASFEDYVAALKSAQNLEWRTFVSADDLIDTSAQPSAEFDAEQAEYDYAQYLVFPASVPEGYYVADIARNGTRTWTMIASSNLTAYVSRATNKTVVWVNDASSNRPVAGAQVGYDGDASTGTTDAQGVGSVTSTDEQSNIVTVRTAGSALPIVLRSSVIFEAADGMRTWGAPPIGDGVADAYWTYVYTDRPTYKPTDTIKFWGYVEKRDDGARPDTVTADIGFDRVDAPVSANGTYSGELRLRGANAGSFSLQISWGGETVATRGLSVTEYVKPAYALSLTPDVEAAYDGTTVGYTVHGEYFEGTPVNGLSVRVTGECVDETLTLDGAGNARGSFVCQPNDEHHGPHSVWFSVRPARSEEGQIDAGANVLMFGPKIYLDPSWANTRVVNGMGSVDLTVRNTQAVNSYDPETFGPTTRANVAVNGTVTEITYTQTEVGQTYDFVRKQVVKNYRYDRNETQIATFTAYSDADGRVSYAFPAANPDANYFVDLSATDENGRKDSVRVDVWARQDFESGNSNALTFHNDDAEDQWDFPGYALGETVRLSVYQKERPFASPAGARFFYYQAQRGIQQMSLSEEPSYQFVFGDTHVPNVAVYGVLYYDGSYQQVGQQGWWYGSSGYAVSYDSSRSELSVTLTPAQSRYAPGQNATVAVHVADASGAPVRAAVNLNVVDEAYYAIFPESVNPLGDIYRWVSDGVVSTQVTQDATMAAGLGAEKGGGGDRGLGRFTFKDNAAFEVVETDAQGNGTLTFALPDNVTSWRVTAQALNADAKQAGDAQIDVDASLPFFLSPVLRESYLDSDQPTALVRVSGTGVGLMDHVEYSVSIPDASFERSLSAAAGETVRVELPDLPLGTHNVTIEAVSGALKDTVTRQVTIVSSRLVKPVIHTVDGTVDPSTTVDGATDRYTDVTFMDAGVGRYYGELQALSGWWGDRADEALARFYGTQLLNDTFGETNPVTDEGLSAYASGGAGVRLLPYASEDFDLTAKVALLGDTPFSETASEYFDDLVANASETLTPRETAMAFAALAATGNPVLAEMQRVLPELGDDTDVRLWMALGLDAAGDSESARSVYRRIVDADAREKDGYIYLPGDDEETTAERTALLAVLAGSLNEPQRDLIHDYVVNQRVGDTTLPLERLLYVQKTLPHLIAGDTEFSYTLRGSRESATVGRGESVTVKAAPEDLAQFAIQVSKGSLMVVSRYDTPVVDQNAPVDASIRLSRTYSAGGAAQTTFREGDLVKVEVHYVVPGGRCGALADESVPSEAVVSIVPCEQYEVTDVLPSGLSPITPSRALSGGWDGNGECFDVPLKIENQRVSFTASADWETACRNDAFTYYARVVTPGTYAAEPAYIRSVRDPETNNHSDAATIVLTP